MRARGARHGVVPADAVLGVMAKFARIGGVAVGHGGREVLRGALDGRILAAVRRVIPLDQRSCNRSAK